MLGGAHGGREEQTGEGESEGGESAGVLMVGGRNGSRPGRERVREGVLMVGGRNRRKKE